MKDTTVKDHYDNHLGDIYSWMTGDFEEKVRDFQHFISGQELRFAERNKAIDLGCGYGIQSVALAKLGYDVTAVDFNSQLLDELKSHQKGLPINIIQSDIVEYIINNNDPADLIICWGDTLTHLESRSEIEQFLSASSASLANGGNLILSFRDYTRELTGDQRFIPVKSTDYRILTCFLEYEKKKVRVTDLLNEKSNDSWRQKVSHYYKTRISPEDVLKVLKENGLTTVYHNNQKGLTTIVAKK